MGWKENSWFSWSQKWVCVCFLVVGVFSSACFVVVPLVFLHFSDVHGAFDSSVFGALSSR